MGDVFEGDLTGNKAHENGEEAPVHVQITHPPLPRMNPLFESLPQQDASINAPDTSECILRRENCALLDSYKISHLGWIETGSPFSRIRIQPNGSHVLVCLGGEGRIWLDGGWQTSLPGMVCLAPPRVLNAFHAVRGKRWHFCWVRYVEPLGMTPVVNAASPVKLSCNPGILFSIIQGLHAEYTGAGDPHFLSHWMELLHGEVQRFAKPWQNNERIDAVWKRVKNDLSQHWTVAALAGLANCSNEHLRRLCHSKLGRSPAQQLTYMRVQRAAEMLRHKNLTLAHIAAEVGFCDAFALSKIFKKWIGMSPSDYRDRIPANEWA